MNEKELKELLASHRPANEELAKQFDEANPNIIEKLEWQPNEAVISELSTKDLIQLGSRYLNDFAIYMKNILHFELRIEKLLTFLLEEKGIDVNKKFKEDAKKMLKIREQALQESKDALIGAAKKQA